MAAKTNTEKITELEKLGATLLVRLDAALKEVEVVDNAHSETARSVADLRREYEKEIALLKREIEDLKKWKEDQKKAGEERSRRLWAFGPNDVAAVISVFGAAAVAYFISRR
jgi:hypothetical protein